VSNPIKDVRFKLVSEHQKPDSKKRLSIGMAVAGSQAAYNIYRNAIGQIVLDPVTTIPVHEAWLIEKKKALRSVRRGLIDSAAGRTKSLGSFVPHASES
jgi:CRISPR/Cas system-associated protein Csm6